MGTERALEPSANEVRPDFGLADRAFARAAGSSPIEGNAVRLLQDAAQNYPAWLDALRGAERSILFENYIVDDDVVGREFAELLAAKAKAGVAVHVVYDWLGSGRVDALWEAVVAAGGQVRAFNRPRIGSPLGWLSRDHRKTIVVDGRIGFVSGLCVSAKWHGDASRRMGPWRDTGVEIRGPAVVELARAFSNVWRASDGDSLPADGTEADAGAQVAGNMRLWVIAGAPSATSTYRLDLVIASLAHRYLWLADAYFVGTTAYVQALAAAARDGVDVRLLVPGASDIPALSLLSRAGYRALLDAGVRVFEWNGTMLHAKTAVADGQWARVGSTNLNIASWMGNYELDVAIEDRRFGEAMAEQYESDLEHATEIVLTTRNRVRPAQSRARPDERRAGYGSAGRAAAGAVSVGSALGAALTNRRALGVGEAGVLATVSAGVIGLAVVAMIWPRVIAWPLAILGVWLGVAWLVKASALRRQGRVQPSSASPEGTEDGEGGSRDG